METKPAVPTRPTTVRAVLELPEIQQGSPEIISGADALERRVTWVHIAETEEVADLLEGGELVLSSSPLLRDSIDRTRQFLERLQASGASAFVLEAITDDRSEPHARAVLTEAAATVSMPVVLLTAQTRYVRVTQAAHRLLLGEQLDRVERARHVHEVFTELSLAEADEQRIVDATAELTGTSIVLENAAHRVLAFSTERAPEDLLLDWPHGDVMAPVGLPDRRWGRLVAPFAQPDDIEISQTLDRAAQAITLTRMATQNEEDLLMQATSSFLQDLTEAPMQADEAEVRGRSLGMVPADGYLPLVIRLTDPDALPKDIQLRTHALRTEFGTAVRRSGLTALTGNLGTGMFAAVLGADGIGPLDELIEWVTDSLDFPMRVGVGRSVGDLGDVGSELRRAAEIAEIASTMQSDRPFYRAADIRLRGVLAAMRDDDRFAAFVRTELGPLLPSTSAPTNRSDALEFLECFLRHGGNKTAVAAELHMSRTVVYSRVERLSMDLGVSLDDAESRTSLHTALMWWQLAQS